MAPSLERHLLQAAVALGGIVPVFAGAAGMVWGAGFLGQIDPNSSLDSHVRYLSGLLFAMGITFWSFIPTIERRTAPVRLLTAIIFVGGLARLAGVVFAGNSIASAAPLAMELIVTPLLCLWQARIARSAPKKPLPIVKT